MKAFVFIIVASFLAQPIFAKSKKETSSGDKVTTDLLAQRVNEMNSEKDVKEKEFTELVKAKKEDEAVKSIKDDKDYFLVNSTINKEPVLIYSIKNQLWKISEALIKNGANLNAKDKDGKVALMYASEARNKYVVTMLVASKADKTAKDKKGVTADEYVKTNGMQ